MNNTYCPMPFAHIYSGSDGRYDMCCHSNIAGKESKQLRKRTVNDTLPFDHFLSEAMNQIRSDMLEGKEIESCENCYVNDRAGARSKRTDYIKDFGYIDKTNMVTLKLRIFGNYCNLSCYMCHPFNSSTRTNELISLGETAEMNPNWRFEDNMRFTKVSYEETEKNILDNIDKVDQIQITGGEPLQSVRMYEFLEKIPDDIAFFINVGMTTNLTKVKWKNKSLDQIIEKFPNFGMKVSCDHYEDKLKYIRYPIDVDEFENNVFEFRDYLKISPTLSVLNVDDIDDIIDYYDTNFKVKTFFDTASIVNSPFHLTPANHKNYKELAAKYKDNKRFSHLYTYLTGDKWLRNRDYQRKQMFEYLDKLTPTRGDWRKLWNDI
tara:strand:- start:930 stop:2060 length:1131 start_codon:yes stop_codon:yes gene_type:complete